MLILDWGVISQIEKKEKYYRLWINYIGKPQKNEKLIKQKIKQTN